MILMLGTQKHRNERPEHLPGRIKGQRLHIFHSMNLDRAVFIKLQILESSGSYLETARQSQACFTT